MQVFKIQDKEAGNEIITGLKSYEDAKTQLKEFEEQDKKEGIFETDFYEIVQDDLFKYPELIPEQVQEILKSQNFEICGYIELKRINNELNKIGYEFNFGLDAEPYNLQKI
jgi:hypothetical protein